MYLLYQCYYYGRGVKKELAKSNEYLRQAAKLEHPDAQKMLKEFKIDL